MGKENNENEQLKKKINEVKKEVSCQAKKAAEYKRKYTDSKSEIDKLRSLNERLQLNVIDIAKERECKYETM